MKEKKKSNSETLISTLLTEILNLIMKAEREVHVEKKDFFRIYQTPSPPFRRRNEIKIRPIH